MAALAQPILIEHVLKSISSLPEDDRVRGIDLMKFIVSNILKHPDDRMYAIFYYQKIYDEFGQHLPFMQLLKCSGFAEHREPEHVIRFHNNQANMTRLRNVFARLTAAQPCGPSRNKASEDKYDDLRAKCVCGSTLVKTTITRAYGQHQRALCDNCFTQFQPDEIIFHCYEQNRVAHQLGFDLCLRCVQAQQMKGCNEDDQEDNDDDEDSKMQEVMRTPVNKSNVNGNVKATAKG